MKLHLSKVVKIKPLLYVNKLRCTPGTSVFKRVPPMSILNIVTIRNAVNKSNK